MKHSLVRVRVLDLYAVRRYLRDLAAMVKEAGQSRDMRVVLLALRLLAMQHETVSDLLEAGR